ncbi:hypothetical protein ONS95_000893 [Cadophora gregata]|uniref:uncharacterized protein n=1 Tax=Cadophora gregata TaxID=51156 RepID=UPI0026DC8A8F|nr:uncharacterized protein ONS95_000893 [Cadophora gregata]KAK0102914.1 hypothetical protein ONS96_005540 [Cadophora gregata f. sp. sojae]KAK0128949.1 hypothetical protein ONS95_000893 [Cadophora gregata]
MVVQATNTGGDLSGNQFDISMPGGGVGIFNGCTQEWSAPSSGWGAQYGGISAASSCAGFPAALQAGCNWRFEWFKGADNPTVSFKQVACPAAITAKSGCTRADDSSAPKAATGSGNAVEASSSPVAQATPVATSTATPEAAESSSPALSSVAPIINSPAPTTATESTTSSALEVETPSAESTSVPIIVSPMTSIAASASPDITYSRTSSVASVSPTAAPVDDEDDACEL